MAGEATNAGDEPNVKIDLSSVADIDLRRTLFSRQLKKGAKWSWKQYIILLGLIYLVSLSLFAYIYFDSFTYSDNGLGNTEIFSSLVSIAVGSPVLAGFIQGYTMALQRIVLGMNAVNAGVADATEKASKLQDNLGDDFVTNLVKINFKYIDQYYLQTQQQADRSFSLSMWVSVAGFLIVAVGIVLAVVKSDASAYVATGAGIVSEFIAAVFFYLYNRTILSMGNYHRKLVITQNIALALKISEGLPEPQRADVQVELVRTLTTDVNNLLTLEGAAKLGA